MKYIEGLGYYDEQNNRLYVYEDVEIESAGGLEEFLRFLYETDDDRRDRHTLYDDLTEHDLEEIRDHEDLEDRKMEALNSIFQEEEDLPPIEDVLPIDLTKIDTIIIEIIQ